LITLGIAFKSLVPSPEHSLKQLYWNTPHVVTVYHFLLCLLCA